MFGGGRLQRTQIIADLSMGGGLAVMHHHKRQAGVDAASFYQSRAGAALGRIRVCDGRCHLFRRASSSVGQGFRVSE
jgi:hypothetical protein